MDLRVQKQMFAEYTFYVLPLRLGNTRLSILRDNVKKMGGTVIMPGEESKTNTLITHVVVEDSFVNKPEKCFEFLKDVGVDCSHLELVTTKWLSNCLKERKLLDTKQYLVREVADSRLRRNAPHAETETHSVYKHQEDASSVYSPPKKLKSNSEEFVFAQMPIKEASMYNQNIIVELEKLAETFRNSGDQWRAHGYAKAIASIKTYGKNIQTYEEAAALSGIGKKMADKIMEIIESGSLRKVDEVCNNERSKVINLFTKIWGVGPATAQSWYVQGFRTLEDLNCKANLTKQQQTGLKYFEELQERIPQEEVQHIGNIVKENASAINLNITTIPCGSYRRGKLTCGDIDVLLLVEDSISDILTELLERLKTCGLITDDLISIDDSSGHQKYLGICQLPGGMHRRLDIFVAPKTEMATALMHYTGSALFNRSIRLLAAERGMYLSEHYLMNGVVREGSKILNNGHILQTPTEEAIFQHLGLKYVPPEERDSGTLIA